MRLAFLLATPDGLDILGADAKGACLNAMSGRNCLQSVVLSLENSGDSMLACEEYCVEASLQLPHGEEQHPRSLKDLDSRCAGLTMMSG